MKYTNKIWFTVMYKHLDGNVEQIDMKGKKIIDTIKYNAKRTTENFDKMRRSFYKNNTHLDDEMIIRTLFERYWTPTNLDFEDMMSNILTDYAMLMKLKGNVAINVLPGNNLIIEADSV